MSGFIKTSTLLTGLKVAENPRHTLSVMYGKIRRVLEKIPPDSMYRRHTESIVCCRMAAVENNPNPCEVEGEIGCGQIEELIIQAENELELAKKMVICKGWEPLEEVPPPNQWTWPPVK